MRFFTRMAGPCLAAGLAFGGLWRGYGEPPAPPRLSSFAPAGDLLEQVDFFIGRVEASLADPAGFDAARQARTFKDANTLAVLAMALALHDEDFPQKAAMPAMLEAAHELAAAESSGERARASLQAIKAARGGEGARGESSMKWEKTASLAALMKQVPVISAPLKRAVAPGRLERQAKQAAGQSAALAAIAQAALVDLEYADSPEQAAAWVRLCEAMRDGAGEVNAAVHARDPARVAKGMERLMQSCDACHAKFRH
jgi:cytochrome c556